MFWAPGFIFLVVTEAFILLALLEFVGLVNESSFARLNKPLLAVFAMLIPFAMIVESEWMLFLP